MRILRFVDALLFERSVRKVHIVEVRRRPKDPCVLVVLKDETLFAFPTKSHFGAVRWTHWCDAMVSIGNKDQGRDVREELAFSGHGYVGRPGGCRPAIAHVHAGLKEPGRRWVFTDIFIRTGEKSEVAAANKQDKGTERDEGGARNDRCDLASELSLPPGIHESRPTLYSPAEPTLTLGFINQSTRPALREPSGPGANHSEDLAPGQVAPLLQSQVQHRRAVLHIAGGTAARIIRQPV